MKHSVDHTESYRIYTSSAATS